MTDYPIITAIANISVDKAREIFALADFRLSELARWDMERWLKMAGIGYEGTSHLIGKNQ
jgi:DNA repair protein RadC